MYLNALLKMLSCSGLYSMTYWYIDNATTATEISCSSIQPCSHRTSNLGSPHDWPQLKPLLWCYIIRNTQLFIIGRYCIDFYKGLNVAFLNSAFVVIRDTVACLDRTVSCTEIENSYVIIDNSLSKLMSLKKNLKY